MSNRINLVAYLGSALSLALCAACSSSSSAATTSSSASAASSAAATSSATPDAAKEDPMVLWTKKPRKPIESSVKELEGPPISFQMSLPDGFEEVKNMSGESGRYFDSTNNGGSFVFSVVIAPYLGTFEQKLEQLKARETILEQEKTAEGFVIHAEDGKESLSVNRGITVGGKTLLCTASVAAVGGPGKNRDALLQWFDETCKTVRPKK